MKILPVQNNNLQNKKQSFKGVYSGVDVVIKDITSGMVNAHHVVKTVKEGMADLKPAAKQFKFRYDYKPGKMGTSLESYFNFYSDFFKSLKKQKSPLLSSAKAMNELSAQLISLSDAAETGFELDIAKKSLLLLKRIYRHIDNKNLANIKKGSFEQIDRRINKVSDVDSLLLDAMKSLQKD